jgi:colanic acid/amylovoran biosynthesis protein
VRVLILWADNDSKNLGVRALALGAEALCRRAWGEVQISHATYGFKEVPVRLWSQKDLGTEWLIRRRGFARWIAGFDVVLDTRAGDSFADIYGPRRHRTMTLVGEIVRQAHVPLVMSPQTIGPFSTREARALARRSMKTAALVMARDSASAEIARTLGCTDVLESTDVVFALDQPVTTKQYDVLLNVSGLLWEPNQHVDHRAYRETVAAVFRQLRGSGREVTLLSHVLDSPYPDNDTPACHEFAAAMGEGTEVLIPRDLAHVRHMVAGASLVVGSRMHACLNAISVGTPAIALAYSRKFAPLLDDIGWTMSRDLRGGVNPAEVAEMAGAPDLAEQVRKSVSVAHGRLEVCESALRSLM